MEKDKSAIPKRFTDFVQKFPQIGQAYFSLGEAVHQAGPLDEKTRALIKVALSGGAKLEGAFHSHIRKAVQLGVTKEELQHIAFLALPTLGFPTMMALLSWIDDIFVDS